MPNVHLTTASEHGLGDEDQGSPLSGVPANCRKEVLKCGIVF